MQRNSSCIFKMVNLRLPEGCSVWKDVGSTRVFCQSEQYKYINRAESRARSRPKSRAGSSAWSRVHTRNESYRVNISENWILHFDSRNSPTKSPLTHQCEEEKYLFLFIILLNTHIISIQFQTFTLKKSWFHFPWCKSGPKWHWSNISVLMPL